LQAKRNLIAAEKKKTREAKRSLIAQSENHICTLVGPPENSLRDKKKEGKQSKQACGVERGVDAAARTRKTKRSLPARRHRQERGHKKKSSENFWTAGLNAPLREPGEGKMTGPEPEKNHKTGGKRNVNQKETEKDRVGGGT